MLTLFSPVPLRELSASLYKNILDHRWDRTIMDIWAIWTSRDCVPVTSQQSKLCVTIRRQPATIRIQPATIRRQPGNIPSLQQGSQFQASKGSQGRYCKYISEVGGAVSITRPRRVVWKKTGIYQQTDTKFGWVNKKGRSEDHSTKPKNFIKLHLYGLV